MPNHITNRLELGGDQSKINELLEAVRYDNEPIGTLDFNKIRAIGLLLPTPTRHP